MGFSDKEKAKAFEIIADCFYKRNFGTISKSDFEILMFHIFIEHLLDTNQPFDDYTMSKTLGIRQSRVRTLKVQKELRYPRDGFEWKESFVDYIRNASYDDKSGMVKLIVSDVNVLTELRYFIESNGWYDEYQLNPKLFQCRLDFFIKLCEKMSKQDIQLDGASENKIRELEKHSKDNKEKSALGRILEGSMEDGIKSLVLAGSKELLITVLQTLPFGGIAAKAIDFLLAAIEKS